LQLASAKIFIIAHNLCPAEKFEDCQSDFIEGSKGDKPEASKNSVKPAHEQTYATEQYALYRKYF
jgi:hypothetical protein